MSGTSDFKIRGVPVLKRRRATETRRHGTETARKAMVGMAQVEPTKQCAAVGCGDCHGHRFFQFGLEDQYDH